jgi:hypothetical protein
MRSSSLLLALFAVGCSPTVLPPPAPPPPTLPEAAEPIGDNDGARVTMARVVVTTDVPARISQAVIASPRPVWEVTCPSTPCTLYLPYGDHELRFEGLADPERSSLVLVDARHPTEIVNHTLGRTHTSVATHLGVALLVTGVLASLVVVSAARVENGIGHTPPEGTSQALGAVLVTGLGAIVVGGTIMAASPRTTQDGATTQWAPKPHRGLELGLRF